MGELFWVELYFFEVHATCLCSHFCSKLGTAKQRQSESLGPCERALMLRIKGEPDWDRSSSNKMEEQVHQVKKG